MINKFWFLSRNHINFLKANSAALQNNIDKIGANAGGSKDMGNPYESKQQLSDMVKKLDSIYVGVSTMNSQQQVILVQNKKKKILWKLVRIT